MSSSSEDSQSDTENHKATRVLRRQDSDDSDVSFELRELDVDDILGTQVNVKKGIKEFNSLKTDINVIVNETSDVEKGTNDFDLHSYFEESVRQDEKRGRKQKKMGVVFKDLTVVGQGFDAFSISDNLTPIIKFGKLLYPPNWFKSDVGTPFDILHKVDGFCKDGEMLLVLGRPGSGCSTLLRVISNHTETYLDIQGGVTYGGISSKEFERYAGEAIYAPEEDQHYATITVDQTLDFALKMKTPTLLHEEKKRNFRERVLVALTNMFGLAKQRKTIAGNEWVRGLSGGERKRLTISEAMVSQGAIDCWDCSTRGLDAASALDYARSLRIATDTLHKTTVATFYQASENIYDLFDKVLVLEKGRCIYFGSTKEAKPYFRSLGFGCEPRKSTPDFLTGITNSQERIILPGFEATAPTTSAELETAWKNSYAYRKSMKEMAEYERQIEENQPSVEFVQNVRSSKRKGTRKKSIYTANYFTQVVALIKRQSQIFFGNPFDIITRYGSVIIQALVYGSLFYKLPLNAIGGFTRGGALFSSILFNSFMSIGELHLTFFGRPILEKQKSYAFYQPSAFYFAQVVMDIPVLFAQVFLWTIIVYFMFGLDATASKFFIYLFGLFITAMTLTQFFRLLGIASKSIYVSQQVMSVILILMLTYTGYSIPVSDMKPWLKWFYWINPIAYSFKGLFANEMRDLTFDCSVIGAVPYGPTYLDPLYKVCVLPGAVAGETTVTGERYLKFTYDFNISDLSINWVIVFAFFCVFTIANAIIIDLMHYSEGGYSKKAFRRGKAPKQNNAEDEKLQAQRVANAINNLGNNLTMYGGTFLWKEIDYTVKVKSGPLTLLNKIEGWIEPGQMTALMGSSGAGKTTLLDVLAQRKTLGVVSGEMLLNGRPLEIDFERITGYVEQMDVFNSYITVREALQFSAKMRQDASITIKEKYDYVEKVLEMMEMSQLGDAIIGNPMLGEGISVEERKRLTIGMELVAKPSILFLDEPTSGLDSQSSYNIIKFIRKLADAGMPLVCTIHQPSSVLFEFFDRLLLLARGGKTVYFGPIGEKSRVMLDYFEKNGARHCNENENPAEYILEAIGAGVNGKTNTDWVKSWADSEERKQVHKTLQEIEDKAKQTPPRKDKPVEFATSTAYQTWELYKRFNVVWWRSPAYNFGRLMNALTVGLIIGFSFWQTGKSSSDFQTRILAIFQILVLGIMLIVSALPQFAVLRDLFRRDYSSKFYSSFPFSVALIAVDLPYITLTGTVCVVSAYWSAGLDSTAAHGFYVWISFIMFFFFCVSFGQLMAAASPNLGIMMIIMPIFNSFLFLFAGVLSPPSAMPKFWRSWMYWIDPDHYFLEGVVTTVFKNIEVTCRSDDFYVFNAPPGSTCGTYMSDFFNAGNTGYIDNPNDTAACRYCAYANGPQYYAQNEWSYDNAWRNFGIVAGFWLFNIIASVGLVYLFRKQSR